MCTDGRGQGRIPRRRAECAGGAAGAGPVGTGGDAGTVRAALRRLRLSADGSRHRVTNHRQVELIMRIITI